MVTVSLVDPANIMEVQMLKHGFGPVPLENENGLAITYVLPGFFRIVMNNLGVKNLPVIATWEQRILVEAKLMAKQSFEISKFLLSDFDLSYLAYCPLSKSPGDRGVMAVTIVGGYCFVINVRPHPRRFPDWWWG